MKFLAALFSLIVIFLSSGVFAANINAEFKPSQDISHLKEGDIIEVTMRFWPLENADLIQFKKLEKTILFNAFYLAKILNLETSLNNADVVELKALLIVKSSKTQPLFVFNYNENQIEMHLDGIKIEALKDKSADYYILNQNLNRSHILVILGCILIILTIAAFCKRKDLKKFITGMKPDSLKKSRKKYDELFRKANTREDFELIYQEKNNWLKLLDSRSPAHNEFFRILNQSQFKKAWSNEDSHEVKTSFDVIRRSFEK